MADTADTPDTPDTPDTQDTPAAEGTPVERLREHLDEIESRPDEMQQRLDDLGAGIESARRQAESDDLLPEDEGDAGDRSGEGSLDDLDWPEGDEDRETPVGDDFHPGGT